MKYCANMGQFVETVMFIITVNYFIFKFNIVPAETFSLKATTVFCESKLNIGSNVRRVLTQLARVQENVSDIIRLRCGGSGDHLIISYLF